MPASGFKSAACTNGNSMNNNPVIGAGYRTLVRMPEINLGCHNTFLRVFGEAGLFVGLLYVATVLYILWQGYTCPVPEVRCLVVGFVLVFMASSMVSHSMLNYRLVNAMMGVCFGTLTAATVVTRQAARQAAQRRLAPKRPVVTVAPTAQS